MILYLGINPTLEMSLGGDRAHAHGSRNKDSGSSFSASSATDLTMGGIRGEKWGIKWNALQVPGTETPC